MSDVARALGLAFPADPKITGWSVDSRTVAPGDLFFALRGPAHDGNAYVEEALRRGAGAAIAERAVPGPVLVVPDALAALQQIARAAREQWGGEVIGVTGSAGKTSTKEVIAALLSTALPAGKTEGNFNNHVGLPLSILRLPKTARAAVLEIGMNHAGEIRALCEIAKPNIGVVTNVGFAHIENFDTLEGVVLAKRELIEALGPDGTAVLNADHAAVRDFARVHPGRTVTFGFSPLAEVRAEDLELTPPGSSFRVRGVRFRSALAGRHAVSNILAGIAVAGLYGIEPASLVDAVAALAPAKMRGELSLHKGVTILNDCYNSNPDAVRAMLDVLRDVTARRRIAVLGEMLELGRWSEALHREIGHYVAENGISVLVGIRGAARHIVDAAIQAGLSKDAAFFFEHPISAGDYLRQTAREGDAILFKGSRGTRVEQALERFLA